MVDWALRRDVFDKSIRFFIYVMVFWLPYSPAVIETCVVAGFFLLVFKKMAMCCASKDVRSLIISKTPENGSRVLNVPIVAFLLVCVISSLNSVFPGESLRNTLTKTSEWFIIYFLVLGSFKTKKHFFILFGIWFLTAMATSVDAIIQHYFTYTDFFRGNVIAAGDRATASFRTPNGLGAYLLISLSLAISCLCAKKASARGYFFFGILSAMMFWAFCLASSRGALVGIFTIGMISAWLILWRMKDKRYGVVGLIVLMALVGVLVRYFSTSARLNTAAWRVEIWADVFRMSQDRILLGHGVNSFMRLFQEYRFIYTGGIPFAPTYAHNCYLQLLAEVGMVGLGLFLFILFQFFRYVFSVYSKIKNINFLTRCSQGLIFGIAAFLIHSFFDNNWYSLQLGAYLWLSIGVEAALSRYLEEESNNLERHSL